MEELKPHSPIVREFFFWSGIIATFAYRIIVVVNNYSHFWAQIAWYIGTVGFIIYFIHRYQISMRRAKLIKELDLERKIASSGLVESDRQALEYILGTLKSSKEKWNFVFIFVASIVALIWGIYLDFIKGI